AIKYSEAHLIASCYTETSGIKSYMLRDILKSKKGALRPSHFQPLTLLQIVARHKNKGTLEYIKEAKVFRQYKTVHTNIHKSSIVFFLSEILKSALREEEPNKPMFQFLIETCYWLDENGPLGNFPNLFLLKLTQHLGFYPSTQKRSLPYFNLLEGRFQENGYGAHIEKGQAVEGLKQLFGINFDTLHKIKQPKNKRLAVLHLLLAYYAIHLHGFKKPNSLPVLHQLFN
ncbi:MAG: DNA repair protein RecO, partial [Marinirhabdus sp.]